mmetsp:Transcript_15462/g.47847  ORF Transcript_15462/g.47847 Transcript_15462/m.47847 type:complete len:200 (+) Transcript_15462:158-757(+)
MSARKLEQMLGSENVVGFVLMKALSTTTWIKPVNVPLPKVDRPGRQSYGNSHWPLRPQPDANGSCPPQRPSTPATVPARVAVRSSMAGLSQTRPPSHWNAVCVTDSAVDTARYAKMLSVTVGRDVDATRSSRPTIVDLTTGVYDASPNRPATVRFMPADVCGARFASAMTDRDVAHSCCCIVDGTSTSTIVPRGSVGVS